MEAVFKYSTVAYSLLFRNLIIGLGAMIVLATVFGQIKGGRFPSYIDLGMSLLIPICCYLLIVVLIYIFSFIYTVKLTPERISGSNVYGFFLSIKWEEIKTAEYKEMNGIPYILLKGIQNKTALTIPVWLDDIQGFCEAVNELTDHDNALFKLLNESA